MEEIVNGLRAAGPRVGGILMVRSRNADDDDDDE
jgi:hypothetical protein